MENYKLRERLSESTEMFGQRSDESLQSVKKVTLILIRELADELKTFDTLPGSPEINTALQDLLSLLIDLDCNNALDENPAYYSYKTTKDD